MTDLFTWADDRDRARGPCGACRWLGLPPLTSGVRYCLRWATWRRPTEIVACGTWSPA